MTNGTDGEADREVTENETPPRDNRQTIIIALGVVLVILVGLIVGFIVSGGLSDDPVAAPTTTGPVTTIPPGAEAPAATTLPPTTLIPGQLSIPASEDTYVNSFEPDVVNGLDDILEIENDPPENKRGLIRFAVSGIPDGETIQAATFRLFVVKDTEAPVALHLVDGNWTQADTTWTTAPAIGASVGIVAPNVAEGSYVDVDVTGVVQGPGQYDFYLVPSEDDSVEFSAIESGTNPPLLVVDWGSEGVDSAAGSVLELSGEPMVLAGAGDISDCGNDGDTITAELVDDVIAENPGTVVFTAGDNVSSEGTPEEFGSCYAETWGRFKERTRPSPGNDDYNTSNASGYFGYFGEAAGAQAEGYYSYEAGDWQVLALNSNCDEIGGCEEGSAQEQWLREELVSSDARCTLAYWHHPLFSSGDQGGDASVRPLFETLYENGAELVINGHDHNFERFAPQNPEGIHDPVAGIRQFVAGTGGTGTSSIGVIAANSESRFTDAFGVLKLSLYTDGYEWEFLSEDGSGFNDVGIEACH
jgi:acid phosphatase type 7